MGGRRDDPRDATELVSVEHQAVLGERGRTPGGDDRIEVHVVRATVCRREL